jgi:HK97 family phage prohead protease
MHKDYILNIDPNAMRRFMPGNVELRKVGDKQMGRGYAAKFNTLSEDFGGFKERIAPGFFDEVLADDVRALFNHDPNLILGRSTKKTLRIGVDETGLWYEYDDPATTYSLDLLKSLERGDVDQSSFAFSIKEDRWDKMDNIWVRTLLKASKLYDVSPVTYPAYPDTSASKRSLAEVLKKDLVNAIAMRERSLKIKKSYT